MSRTAKDLKEGISSFSSVDRRLTFSFGVLILFLLLSVLIVGGFYIKGVIEREERQLSTLLTQVLATSVSRVSFSGRYHAQLLLEDIQKERSDIEYIFITDINGHLIAHSDKEKVNNNLTDEERVVARKIIEGQVPNGIRRINASHEFVLEVTLPYRGSFDNSIQGVVQVGISLVERNYQLNRGLVIITAVVTLLLLTGIFIVRRLSQHFGKPIRQLARDMDATLHAIPDLLLELDEDGRYLQILTSKKELLVDTKERLLGRTTSEVLPEAVADIINNALMEASINGESHGKQYYLLLADGIHWFELSVAKKIVEKNDSPNYIVLSRDITSRKNAEDELRLFANVFEKSAEAIMITDHENIIVAVNPALIKLTGYSQDDLIGKPPSMLSSGTTSKQVYQELWSSLETYGHWQGELIDQCKNGDIYPKWTMISVIYDENKKISHYVAHFTDITERKANEERIYHLAHYDRLTDIYNRFSLEERLSYVISQTRRENEQLAVMFIDLDKFKIINDTLGHHIGDDLLIEAAKRIKNSVRENDIFARLGGDEFVVVLTNIKGSIGVANVAEKLFEKLRAVYHIEGHELRSNPSVGISIFPTDGEDVDTLMKNADTAMYHAKEQGRNNYQFFTGEMNAIVIERMGIERDLRTALQNNEFKLYYQPKIEAVNGKVCGVEALIRWFHPERGMVAPDKFIYIAEETGFIQELGSWVLEEACRQLALWKELGLSLTMAVNLSPKQLGDPELVRRLKITMDKYNILEDELELEITETAAMANAEHAIKQMKDIRIAGVNLAIDDFGTGYSSLAYLKLFPIQTLKLDRTFVGDIEDDENDAAICLATISLAHNLGLKVVAEGVETEAQKVFLTSHKCDLLQGYLFSRPLPADGITEYITSNN